MGVLMPYKDRKRMNVIEQEREGAREKQMTKKTTFVNYEQMNTLRINYAGR